ncbi:MAG: hypothetical protein K2X38_10875 [Gemmataceae bacterium]|nr:hypothetical protein [Gemmataceae bacterium]
MLTTQIVSNEVSHSSWTQDSVSTSSQGMYQAGNYINNAYSLPSVSASQQGSSSWTYSQSQDATDSGTYATQASGSGNAYSPYYGQSAGPIATGTFVQASSGTFTSSSASSANQSGTQSSSLSQKGAFGATGYALSSVVYQADTSYGGTWQSSGDSQSTGVSQANYTITQWGAQNTTVQIGQDDYSQVAEESFAFEGSSSSSSTLYQAGTFGLQSYAFTSVAYQESNNSASLGTQGQRSIESGVTSWTALSSGTGGVMSLPGTGLSQAESKYRGSYLNTNTNQSVQGAAGTSSLDEEGSFANGQYSFSSYVFDSSSRQTATQFVGNTNSYIGSGTDSSTFNGSLLTTSNYGLESSASAAASSDSYADSGWQSSAETTTSSSRNELHQEGVFQGGQYSLSCVASDNSGDATRSSLVKSGSTSFGTLNASSISTTTKTSMGVAGGTWTGDTSAATYASAAAGTLTETSLACFQFTQKGTYDPVNGYAFSSVVQQSLSQLTGTLEQYSAETQTTEKTAVQRFENNIGNSLACAGHSLECVTTSSFESISAQTSTVELSTNASSNYQSGIFAAGSYAFSSVVLQSASTDSVTALQTQMSLKTGTNAKISQSRNTATNFSSSGSDQISTSSTTNTSLFSLQATGTFVATSDSSTSENRFSATNLSQRGVYAGGSYAFSSLVFQASSSGSQSSISFDTNKATSSNASYTSSTYTAQTNQAPGPLASSVYSNITTTVNSSECYTQIAEVSTQTTSLWSAMTTAFSLYQAGVKTPNVYALSSVAFSQSVSQSSGFSDRKTSTATSNVGTFSSSANTYSSSATGDPSGYAPGAMTGGNAQGTTTTGTNALVRTLEVQTDRQQSETASFYEEGTFAQGSYSFSSVVFDASKDITEGEQVKSWESYTQTSDAQERTNSSLQSFVGPILGLGRSSLDTTTKWSESQAVVSYTATNGIQSRKETQNVGSYDGAADDYAFSDVRYSETSANSSSLDRTTRTTQKAARSLNKRKTESTSGLLGQSYAFDQRDATSTDSVTRLETESATSLDCISVSAVGSYANGGYAYSSVVYDSLETSSTRSASRTDSTMTQSVREFSVESISNLLPVPNAQYSSTASDIRSTRASTETRNEAATSRETVHYEGSWSTYAWSLSSVSYQQFPELSKALAIRCSCS